MLIWNIYRWLGAILWYSELSQFCSKPSISNFCNDSCLCIVLDLNIYLTCSLQVMTIYLSLFIYIYILYIYMDVTVVSQFNARHIARYEIYSASTEKNNRTPFFDFAKDMQILALADHRSGGTLDKWPRYTESCIYFITFWSLVSKHSPT